MNQRKLMGWLIAAVYTAIVIAGVIYLIDMEIQTKSLVIGVAGIITVVISLLALKERNLKRSFFIAGLILANFAIGYGWKQLEALWKVLGFALMVSEILYILIRGYFMLNLPRKKLTYTNAPTNPLMGGEVSSAQMNIQEYCKSKYHNKDEIDGCTARLLQ